MNNVKEQIKKLKNSDYFPFVVLAAIELFIHLFFISPTFRDDVTFAHFLDEQGILDWSISFFETWSSRIFINFVLVIFASLPSIVWKIADVGMILLLTTSISSLFIRENKRFYNWVVTALFLIFPFTLMSTAGWIATTTNYLWPAAAGAYCLTLLKRESSVGWYDYIKYGFATLYATSLEQLSVIFVVILSCFTAHYSYIKRTRNVKQSIFLLMLTVSNLYIHISCPGNQSRFFQETVTWNPDFYMRSLIEKLQLGFSETMSKALFAPNVIFLCLTGIIFWKVLKKYGTMWWRMVFILPFASCLLLGFFPANLMYVFPQLSIFSPLSASAMNDGFAAYGGLITFDNFSCIQSYLPFIVMLFSMLVCAIGIYLSIDSFWISLLATLVYFCGIGSGMIMGFSPTLYASSSRPLTNSYLCFLIVIILILQQNDHATSDKQRYKLLVTLAIAGGLNMVNLAVASAQMH